MQIIEKVLYRAEARAEGGRDGHAFTPDHVLDVKLATPKELGGPGGSATNPEQLFAAGYSACFLSAIKHVALREKIVLPSDTSVAASVGLGQIPQGFGIEVDLRVRLPGMEQVKAQALVEKAHAVCPYSNATRGNIQVRLVVL
jgi:lipoyl-dependent peroxiredoxin